MRSFLPSESVDHGRSTAGVAKLASGNLTKQAIMDIAFETPRLRVLCESDTEARRFYPQPTVLQLHDRLADIRAAMSASDLVIARASFQPSPPARVRFELDGGYELVCEDSREEPYLDSDGLVDFDRMRRVKVVKFGRLRRG